MTNDHDISSLADSARCQLVTEADVDFKDGQEVVGLTQGPGSSVGK